MPTGYTSEIYDGKDISGKDFIIRCARAFGATIMMRDDPLDKEIPEEFKPSTYHQRQLNEAREHFKKYTEMSYEEAQKLADEEYNQNIINDKKYEEGKLALNNRYENTLIEVKKWEPPTSEHVELKKFAIQQLEDSIKWDCALYPQEKYKKETPQEYLERKMSNCLKNIEYHQKEWDKEVERTNERNLWIKQLRESLA